MYKVTVTLRHGYQDSFVCDVMEYYKGFLVLRSDSSENYFASDLICSIEKITIL